MRSSTDMDDNDWRPGSDSNADFKWSERRLMSFLMVVSKWMYREWSVCLIESNKTLRGCKSELGSLCSG